MKYACFCGSKNDTDHKDWSGRCPFCGRTAKESATSKRLDDEYPMPDASDEVIVGGDGWSYDGGAWSKRSSLAKRVYATVREAPMLLEIFRLRKRVASLNRAAKGGAA